MSENQNLSELVQSLEELQRRRQENRLAYYVPYAKQAEFHAMGATRRERLLFAGNQVGKSFCGAAESAYHLTGRYPDWWKGRRFDKPTTGWEVGITSESTRDNNQRLLLGTLGQYGTGSLPKETIIDVRMARGVPDAVDSILVRHVSGGQSQVNFKSYERGREKLQGPSLDWIHADEEPDQPIYSEILARIAARQGVVYLTCTPLLGMTEVIRKFLNESNADRGCVNMTIEDAEHISPEERAKIVAGYPLHEREARTKGTPMLGSGRVFPIAEESIRVTPFAIPKHWPRIAAIDFGYDHATAGAWVAWDRDTDTVYLYDCYKQREQTPVVHTAAFKAGEWIPVAWPHDGEQREKGSGESLAAQYRKLGLRMLPERATFVDGGNSLEAGVLDMLSRMQTSRFKVFEHLSDWFDEFRLYHREKGRIVAEYDDALSASRYALMMLRAARIKPDYSQSRVRMADGLEWSPLDPHGTNPDSQRSTPGVVWGNGRPANLEYRRNRSTMASGID